MKMNKLPFDSDEELLADIANSDSRAFEILYRRYFSKLYGAAYKRLQDKELTEEIVQELFVSLWERRKNLPVENIENYLFIAVKYLVIAQYKKNSLFEKYSSTLNLTENGDNLTEQTLAFEELSAAYQKALLTIPERCREIFLLKRNGLSLREISEKLDISEKTVENQMTKALKILREALKEYTTLAVLFSSIFANH